MPVFAYRVATVDGATAHGIEQASSPAALERALAARGLFPLEVRLAEQRAARRRSGITSRRQDVTGALRYLATLLGAGFPLDRALAAVTRVAARQDVADALAAVRERVRGGAHLADAFAEQPRIFPRIAVGMTRAGERGGQLADALERLAAQLEREQALRSRIAAALTYPAVLAVAGTLVLAMLLGYVLPRFAELLADAGAALPRSTALLLAAADAAERWWPVAVGAAIAAPSAGPSPRCARMPAGAARTSCCCACRCWDRCARARLPRDSRARWGRCSARACRCWLHSRSRRAVSRMKRWPRRCGAHGRKCARADGSPQRWAAGAPSPRC